MGRIFIIVLMFSGANALAQSDTGRFNHMVKVAIDWRHIESDSAYVADHSETDAALQFYNVESLPVLPGIDLTKSKKGDVIGPCSEGNSYRIYKNAGNVRSADSVQVSHILFAYKGGASADPELQRTKEQAKKSADSLCRLIQRGSVLLENVVEQISDDPGSKGGNKGNYGWFTHESGFVEPFKRAGFDNPVGTTLVVETEFGYHIIQVEAKTKERDYFRFWEIVERIDTCYTLFGGPVILIPASFPGGNSAVLRYIKTELPKYDSLSSDKYAGLSVMFTCTVLNDGSIGNVELFVNPFPGTKAEEQFIQIVRGMKGWKPAETCNGPIQTNEFFAIEL